MLERPDSRTEGRMDRQDRQERQDRLDRQDRNSSTVMRRNLKEERDQRTAELKRKLSEVQRGISGTHRDNRQMKDSWEKKDARESKDYKDYKDVRDFKDLGMDPISSRGLGSTMPDRMMLGSFISSMKESGGQRQRATPIRDILPRQIRDNRENRENREARDSGPRDVLVPRELAVAKQGAKDVGTRYLQQKLPDSTVGRRSALAQTNRNKQATRTAQPKGEQRRQRGSEMEQSKLIIERIRQDRLKRKS